jgi:hypothetical protein
VLGRILTRAGLGDRIEEATRRIAQSYQKGLKEVEEAKTQINDLELTAVDSGSIKNNRLDSALDLLMKLTDSMIFESGRAWDEYEKLEHDCKVDECESSDLDGLRELCKKTEEFATDLLCYSLAHFKRKDASNSQMAPG